MVSAYAALESWTHQLITPAAKDRLNLSPPTLGACAYRREALERAGGFPASGSGGDVQISARLARAGWRTRFVSQAIADNRVADRLDDYWHQHVRWTRNLFASARSRPLLGGQSSAGLPQRIECWMAAAGYIDRLALFAAAALAFTGLLPAWLPAAYLAVLAVEVAVAVAKEGVTRRLPVFLTAVIALFWVDLLASVAGTLAYLLRRPGRWLPSQRQLRQADQG